MVYGREVCPDTKRKHLQGFVYFKNNRSPASVRAEFAPRHVEKSVAPLSAITYAKKEGDFTERGVCPVFKVQDRASKGGKASKENYHDFIRLSKLGQFDEVMENFPALAVQHYRTMFALKKDFCPPPANLVSLENYWFWGPPGTGKSHRARTMFGDVPIFVKGPTKWWDGYNGEKIVVIDDLGAQHDWLVDHIKVWCDKYPFNAEIKGGNFRIRPAIVIITSNRSITQLFGEKYPLDLEPLYRRFTEEYMCDKYVSPPDLSDLDLLGSLSAGPHQDDDSFPSLPHYP